MVACCFHRCLETARPGKPQCEKHKKKRMCTVAGCVNQANKHRLCVSHGARKGVCKVAGCNNENLRVDGKCFTHSKSPNAAAASATMTRVTTAAQRKLQRTTTQQKYSPPLDPLEPPCSAFEWSNFLDELAEIHVAMDMPWHELELFDDHNDEEFDSWFEDESYISSGNESDDLLQINGWCAL
ncbi:hypothetical protein LEN26_019992 [Aphanomyces euteiches]|nr:hypothetical protein LEN26_019992 [Aphanomyces euteiches]KAH9115654.1 hypothetical protein AeMF1_010331 [Aphanomyces euteiches]KAH9193467.1 hypothetical protein AeNC1_004556 [Aphanomyces euteiches]